MQLKQHIAIECPYCVATARRYLRVGRTCANGLLATAGVSVLATLLLTAPDLRPGQWLGVLLVMHSLFIAMNFCVYKSAQHLDLSRDSLAGLFGRYALFPIVVVVLQLVYMVGYFPAFGSTVSTRLFTSGWWNVVGLAVVYVAFAALARELFFNELLEAHSRIARPPAHLPIPRQRRRKSRPSARIDEPRP